MSIPHLKQDKHEVERLSIYREKSFKKLSNLDEDSTKRASLEAAIKKRSKALERKIGGQQLWRFSGGCCGGIFPCGPGSWKGEGLYKKNPPTKLSELMKNALWCFLAPEPTAGVH